MPSPRVWAVYAEHLHSSERERRLPTITGRRTYATTHLRTSLVTSPLLAETNVSFFFLFFFVFLDPLLLVLERKSLERRKKHQVERKTEAWERERDGTEKAILINRSYPIFLSFRDSIFLYKSTAWVYSESLEKEQREEEKGKGTKSSHASKKTTMLSQPHNKTAEVDGRPPGHRHRHATPVASYLSSYLPM